MCVYRKGGHEAVWCKVWWDGDGQTSAMLGAVWQGMAGTFPGLRRLGETGGKLEGGAPSSPSSKGPVHYCSRLVPRL